MKLSEYISKFDKELSKGIGAFGDGLDSMIDGFGEKVEEKINTTDNYLGEKIGYAKKEWKKLKPEVRSDITKGAIGAGVALVTPWYLAIPSGIYAYKKAKKFLKLKKSYPKEE